jgi:hypothetical protein
MGGLRRRGWIGWGAAALSAPLFAQQDHAGHAPPAQAGPASKKKPRPQLGMGAALAPDGTPWVVRLIDGRLVTQVHQGDKVWSTPRVLDIGADQLQADGENSPKLAFGPGGVAVISYTQALSKPFTGAIRLLRSSDGGAHFAPPITVHQDRQEITHRFEAMAFDGRGRLHLVWIDKRDLELARKAGRPYEGAALYRSYSDDGGASFAPELKLTDASCECCRIALAPAPDGGLAALWRHVFAGSVRDHGFARLDGEAREPQRATMDGWVLKGCPHHGPGLAAAADGGWHAVWFGQRDGLAAVRYGQLASDGSPRGKVMVLPDAAAEHAAIAAQGERLAIVWRAFDGKSMLWRAWLSTDQGRSFNLRTLGRSSGDTDHPRVLAGHQAAAHAAAHAAGQGAGQGRMLALWNTVDQGVQLVDLFE